MLVPRWTWWTKSMPCRRWMERAEEMAPDAGYFSGSPRSRWWCPSTTTVPQARRINSMTSSSPTGAARFVRIRMRTESRCEPGFRRRLSGMPRGLYQGQGDWESLAIAADAVLRRHRAWMSTSAAKEVYPAGRTGLRNIKEQQGARRFLLRGLTSVAAEWMLATAFNLRTLWRAWRSRAFVQLPHGPSLRPAS